jgi:hypothetical protein
MHLKILYLSVHIELYDVGRHIDCNFSVKCSLCSRDAFQNSLCTFEALRSRLFSPLNSLGISMACALGCKICKVCLLLLDLCWNGELFSDFLFGFTWLAELILAPVANCEAVAGGGFFFVADWFGLVLVFLPPSIC